jgi:hypothetical protein
MLLSNIEEIKGYYSRLNINSDFTSFTSFIQDATIKYLTPLIGQETIDVMELWYEGWDGTTTDPVDEANAKLLSHIQRCLVYYMMLDAAPTLALDLGDNGLTEKTTDGTTPVRLFVYEKLVEYLSQSADTFAENLLLFLELNADDYLFWDESESRQNQRKLFLDSGKRLGEFIPMTEPRRFYLGMIPSVNKIESLLIHEILGTAFFDELKTEMAAGTLTPENALLVTKIRPVVAYNAMVDCLPNMSVAVGSTGIRILNQYDSQRNRSAEDTQNGIVMQYRGNATTYEALLRKFLNDNYSDYPLYEVPVLPTDPGANFQIADNTFKRSFRF